MIKREKTLLKNRNFCFIDIGATYCGACKALDSQIFSQEKVMAELSKFVQLKIDSDVHTAAYEKVKAKYSSFIHGFPTYLIIDPTSEEVLKKWSVEIDSLSLEGIIDEFEKLRVSHTPTTHTKLP